MHYEVVEAQKIPTLEVESSLRKSMMYWSQNVLRKKLLWSLEIVVNCLRGVGVERCVAAFVVGFVEFVAKGEGVVAKRSTRSHSKRIV